MQRKLIQPSKINFGPTSAFGMKRQSKTASELKFDFVHTGHSPSLKQGQDAIKETERGQTA